MLKELNKILCENPHINEIDHLKPDFISALARRKTNFYVENNKLAISKSAFKMLYCEAMEILMKFRKNIKSYKNYYISFNEENKQIYLWENSAKNCEKFTLLKNIEIPLTNFCLNFSDLSEVILATNGILLINGEHNTAMNIKREIFLLKNCCENMHSTKIKNTISELEFISLINLKFRKSDISWSFRKMLIRILLENKEIYYENYNEKNKLFEENILFSEKYSFIDIIKNEQYFLNKNSRKQPRNYLIHEYRLFLYENYISKNKNLLISEYKFLTELCENNIKDTGNFHYLFTKIIPNLQEKMLEIEAWKIKIKQKFNYEFIKNYN